MPIVWIAHREPRQRSAIARLAAAPEDTVLGAPGDPIFEAAPAADVVVLGLAGENLEVELQFAHSVAPRLAGASWILLGNARQGEAARRLFDTLDARFLLFPPSAEVLRAAVRAPSRTAAPHALSARAGSERLASRFARWLADLDLPDLLRALDPRQADTPLLVRGEPGTGRELLVRYVHAFGGTAGGALIPVPCDEQTTPEGVLRVLAAEASAVTAAAAAVVWLEDVDRLPPATQRRVRSWIEFGLPPGLLRTQRVRWIGSAGPEHGPELLLAELRCALSGLCVRLPALRDRVARIAPFADEAARAWAREHRELHARRFGEDAVAVLETYPWPGNLRELEAVVDHTLAATTSDPIRSYDLQYEGTAFAPIDATTVGSLIEEDEDVDSLARLGVSETDTEWQDWEPQPPAREAASAAAGPAQQEPAPPAPEPAAANELPLPAGSGPDPALSRLAGALAHEVRNPLATIRTFASLLPERFADPDFRGRFAEMVNEDVGRIETHIEHLSRLASLAPPSREPVDVSALLEELLEERRDLLEPRRLLVLKELDNTRPLALGDAEQLRFALGALLGRSLAIVPEGGDVYVASRRHEPSGGAASLRVLVRFHGPERGAASSASHSGVSFAENTLDFAIAELVIRSQGGALAIDTTDGDETVIVIDLPAP